MNGKSIELTLSHLSNQNTSLDIVMPEIWKKYNTSIKRLSKGGSKHETSATAGPFTMTLKEEILLSSSPKVDLLFTSNFLEKVLVKYNHDNQQFRFSTKKGQDHLCIDVDYKLSLPTFEATVEVRSNKLPKDKLNLKTEFNGNQFSFKVENATGQFLDINAKVPDFHGTSGEIVITGKASAPLPSLDSEIKVGYSFEGAGKTASLTGTVNGKTATIKLDQEMDDKFYVTSVNVESPIDAINKIKAELKFNPSGQIDISFKSDNLDVEADASLSGLDIDVKSTWYNIEVDFDISSNNLACELSVKDNQTGSKEYIKVNGQLEGTKVDIQITSSISGFESISASGSIQESQNGYAFTANGITGSQGYTIKGEYSASSSEYALNLKADNGSKYLKIETETKFKKSGVKVVLAIASSEFVRYQAILQATETTETIEFKTKLSKGKSALVDMHVLLDNSTDRKGMIVTMKTPSSSVLDAKALLGFEGTKVTLEAAAIVPYLGMDEESFRANFAFQPLKMNNKGTNFELTGDVVVMGVKRKMSAKVASDHKFNNQVTIGLNSYSVEIGTKFNPSNSGSLWVEYNNGRIADVTVTLPSGSDTGTISIGLKTAGPLPVLDGKIDVSYSFAATRKTAELTGRVNGKTASVKLTQADDSEGAFVTEMEVKSPLDALKNMKATLKYNPSGEVTVDFKGGNMSLTAKANMSGFNIKAESTRYNISANVAICIENCNEQLKCEFRVKDKKAGGEEFIKVNAKVKGNEVTIEMESSVPGFEKIVASGSIQKTQSGYAFSATGDTGSEGYSIEGDYKVTSKKYALNLKADYGSKYLKIKTETKFDNNGATVEMALESSEFQKYQANITARGTSDSAVEFQTKLSKGNTSFVDMHVLLENSDAQKGLIATMKTPSGTVIDFQGVVGFKGRKVTLKAAAAAPYFGMDDDSFKASIVYQPLEVDSDGIKFEVLGDLALMGVKRMISLKFNSDKMYNNEIEVTFNALGHNYSIRMGSEVYAGPTNLRLYINQCEVMLEKARDSASLRLKIEGSINLGLFGGSQYDMGKTEITAKTSVVSHGMKLEINGSSTTAFNGTFGLKVVIRDRAHGDQPGLEISASGAIETDTVQKKVAILVDTSYEGSIEVSYGNGRNNKVVMALSRAKRSAHATIVDDDMGNMEFAVGESLSNGLLVLKTSQGLHKVGFGLDRNDGYDISFDMESPLLADNISGEVHLNSNRVGAAYQVDRVRREIGLEYDLDDTSARVTLQTPFQEYRKFSVRSAMHDVDNYEFGFEADMESNQFAFGVAYDFSSFKNLNGDIKAKYQHNFNGALEHGEMGLKCVSPNSGDFWDSIDMNLYFKTGPPNAEKEMFRMQSSLNKKGDWREFKLTAGPNGRNDALDMTLKMKMTEMDATVSYDGKIWKARLERKGEEHFEIAAQTPLPGYEKLLLTYKKTGEGETRQLILTKNGNTISELTIKPFMDGVYGIDISFKFMQIWAKFNCQARIESEDTFLTLALNTSNADYKRFDVKVAKRKEGANTWKSEIDVNVLEKYYRETFTSDGCTGLTNGEFNCKGEDVAKTNFAFFGFAEAKTNYDVQAKNGFSVFNLGYKSEEKSASGEVRGKYEVDLDVKLFTKMMFKAAGTFGDSAASWLGLTGNFNAQVQLESTSNKIQMRAKTSGYKLKLEARKSGSGYQVKLASNIPGFEKLDGTLASKESQGTRMISLNLKKEGKDYMTVGWNRETDFKSFLKASIQFKSGGVDQELGFNAKGALGADEYDLEGFTKGTSSNMKMQVHMSMKEMGDSAVLSLTASLKGDGIFIRGVDYQAALKGTFTKNNDSTIHKAQANNSGNIQFTVKDNTKGDEWSLTMDQEATMSDNSSGLAANLKASASLKTPSGSRMPPVTLELSSDFAHSDSQLKLSLKGKAEGGAINVRINDLGFNFDKPAKHFKLAMDCSANGKTFKLVGDVESYKNIEITFELPKDLGLDKFKMSSKADFKSATDFKCTLHLDTPWTGEHGILFEGSPKDSGFDISGRYDI